MTNQLPYSIFITLGLPLLSFSLLLMLGKKYANTGAWLATGLLFLSTLASAYVFFGGPSADVQFAWFKLGSATFHVGFLANEVARWMVLIVHFIALLVHVFSVAYMSTDPAKHRYYAFLGLFTFAMSVIVLADNLLVLFIGWELVGFASFLLIGFWHRKESAAKASKKAFIMNRIGDAGFLIALMSLWANAGTLDLQSLSEINLTAMSATPFWLHLAGVGLFMGVMGKSAQFPLQTWLPDAMEGPTPVSALIHAATMVAAGVYLLIRMDALFSQEVLQIMAWTGAITALLASISAMAQNDIKKVLAYSTIAQLGLMVVAVGVGAFGAAFFHLTTHAFFKAALFLAAGSIIHSLHHAANEQNIHFDAQDMRLMGGLRKALPITFFVYLVATAALCGLPLFAGFLSKEGILAAVWHHEQGLTLFSGLFLVTLLLTPIYMGRQVLMIFFEENRAQKEGVLPLANIHEGNYLIKIPLILLAVLSLSFAFSFNPIHPESSWLFGAVPYFMKGQQVASLGVMIAGIAISIIGLVWAYFRYRIVEPKAQNPLLAHHFYIDHFYQYAIIQNIVLPLSRATAWFDQQVIDRTVNSLGQWHVINAHISAWFDSAVVDGLVRLSGWISLRLGNRIRTWQIGHTQSLMLGMVFFTLVIMWWILG